MAWLEELLNRLTPPAQPPRGILSPPENSGTGLLSFPEQQAMGLFGPLPPQLDGSQIVNALLRGADATSWVNGGDDQSANAGSERYERIVAAANPPQVVPVPVPRPYRPMTRDELANIIFNETRSLSGPGLDNARYAIAHAIRNGEQQFGSGRPFTAPTTVGSISNAERAAYYASYLAAQEADADRWDNTDPVNGATHFNLRPNNSGGPFQGNASYPLVRNFGPFNNSLPTRQLPATGVYVDIYHDPRTRP
jgi:hypothetical protein